MSRVRRPTRRAEAVSTAIADAAEILRYGGLVAFPTETVYGLGADATNGAAVAGIYAAKTRPSFNPLIAHVDSMDAARAEGAFPNDALTLANAFWPGPLTLVVPLAPASRVSPLARAGLDTVALRMPAHPVARALIAAVGRPIAAPSANRSGRVSPTTAAHVAADLDGRIDMILDGGSCDVGIESTIVACLGGEVWLLRAGGITREALEHTLARPIRIGMDAGMIAPGMLATHYAPRAGMRLEAIEVRRDEAVLDFHGRLRPVVRDAVAYLDLSASGDLREAAANLFGFMRRLDDAAAATIVVAPVPWFGLGLAINDRLSRAAAPRPRPSATSRPAMSS